jgi:hypothetical protein
MDCQLMKPVAPNIEKTGFVQLQFERTGDQTFVRIVSRDFPEFEAERQALVNGSVKDEDPAEDPAWVVRMASGRRAIETKSHGSRNGEGTGILISSYEMTTNGSLPEDFFQYHAVGLCQYVREGSLGSGG